MGLRLLLFFIGYLIGCLQSAYATGRVVKGIDVREHGSGSAGMTNVVRVVGRLAGLFVFIFDVLKAIGAFLLGSLVIAHIDFEFGIGLVQHSYSPLFPNMIMEGGIWAGLGVIIGHSFPIFLGFRGGKGIASALGLMLVIDWRAALVVYAIGTVVVLISRYISLASLTMVFLFPIFLFFLGHATEVIVIVAVITALAFYLHRSNIQRLLAGNENKFSLSRKNKPF